MKYYFLADVGGTHIKYALSTSRAKFVFEGKVRTEHKNVVKQLKELIKPYRKNLKAIGIASTGVVDNRTHKIVYAGNNLKVLQGTNYRLLAKYFNVPIWTENDAKAAAYSEIKKSNNKNFALVTFGTGVGTGVVWNGQLLRGKNFLIGELGYTKLNDNNLNNFLSFSSFNNKIKQQFNFSSIDNETFDNTYQSNSEFRTILNDYLKNVALFLAQVSIYFDLDEIIFGGGISYLNPSFLKKIEDYFYQELANTPFKTKIKPTQLKNSAGLVGVLKLLQTNKL